jgi:hypothetical protein
MKIICLCFLSIGMILSASAAQADACETVLCMAGKLEGQSGGGACSGPIADYFNIIKYGKHWRFSPTATIAARLNFLNSCGSAVGNWPSQINAVYGATLL